MVLATKNNGMELKSMNILGLFPGQGSQSVGMGKDWFDKSDEAKKIFATADEVLGYSLSKLCFEGPIDDLTLTQNAQPALLTVGYISYKLSNLNPSIVAGHSLGEYTALLAANSLKFEDAVKLVHNRGQYMQEAIPVGVGAMVAVMGMDEDKLRDSLANFNNGVVEIANINSPGQIVLAGEKQAVSKFTEVLNGLGAKTILLNVSAPFHCGLMKPAADKLALDLDKVEFKAPEIKAYSNFSTKEIKTAEDAKNLLKEQVCGTVNWTKELLNIFEENDVQSSIEFGPGGVLSKLMKRINPKISRFEVFDFASLENAKSKLEITS